MTTREYGAPSQLEKLAALDFADLVVLNKFDRSGAEDALKEIRKQVQRNRTAFDQPLEAMPVVPTIASQFADAGVDLLWSKLASIICARTDRSFHASEPIMGSDGLPRRIQPIPPERQGYLAEVAGAVRAYHDATALTSERLRLLQHLETASNHLDEPPELAAEIETLRTELEAPLAALEDHRRIAEDYRSRSDLLSRSGQGHPRGDHDTDPLRTRSAEGGAPGHLRLGRPAHVDPVREPPRSLPLQSWGLPVQASR